MYKALNEFGGWLRVYFVLNMIEVALGAVVLIPMGGTILLFKSSGPISSLPSDVAGTLTVIVALTILVLALLLMNLYVLRIMKMQESDIPTRLSIVTILVFAASPLVYLGGAAITHFYPAFQTNRTEELGFPILYKAVWSTIWIFYFKNSKRVRLYYGANAFQKRPEKGTST